MNKDLRALEYDKVLQALKQCASSECAKEYCLTLRPFEKREEALQALEETDGALVLYYKFGTPSFSGLNDITGCAKRAAAGAVLSIAELLRVRDVLSVTGKLARYAADHNLGPALEKYTLCLHPNKYLEERLNVSFIGEDEVADAASSALKDIRRKQAHTKNKIKTSLESYIRSPGTQKYLQDNIITLRNDRYVLPVKAENRGEIQGLVHDTSASGATLFIEPMSVVTANNELSVLLAEERREIEKILQELSSEVATIAEALKESFETARFFDFTFAKAKYAEKCRATMPVMENRRQICLRQARHPLIDPEKVVATDVALGKDCRAMIVTGPNTGGKTVSLKTVGLLTLMAKSGLFIPAKEESRVDFFDRVFADIGDEQSIEQSLSTFSAHMSNIIAILDRADENSLVLLDELGSGTDPAEGAALAISVIEHLNDRGALIMTTTHYAELKLFALQTPWVENASCEFDVATLKPTYRLITGVPGKSNAFAIAARLGLSETVIAMARYHLDNETVKMEKVIADLEISKKEAEYAAEKAEKDLILAREEAEKAKLQAEEMKAQAAKELQQAKQKALAIAEQASREADALLRQLEDLQKEKDRKDFRDRISAAKADVKTMENKAEKALQEERKKGRKQFTAPLKPGDTVIILSLEREGIVVSPADAKGMVQVQAGIIKTKVHISDLAPAETKKVTVKISSPAPSVSFKAERGSRRAENEVDLRGMTVYEAESTVDEFLNNCYLAGLKTVSVIHGKGTGALRTAVKNQLKRHPLVAESRLGTFGEGETGVTIVTLK